jgi:hypothetical protein
MGRDDMRTTGVTLRDGWEKASDTTYYLCPNGGVSPTHGLVSKMYSGGGWVGVAFASDEEDLKAPNIPTLEEAMIWVEMTYALVLGGN